jgi:hypothetical protein
MSVAAPPAFPPATVVDARIDVFAQYSLQRMSRGDPDARRDAVEMLAAVRGGDLAGIYKVDELVPAKRAQALGKGWWQLISTGEDAAVVLDPRDPLGGQPIIVFRDRVRSLPSRLDPALRRAFASHRAFRSQPVGACRVTDGPTVAEAEFPVGGLPLALVVPQVICGQLLPPAPPGPDSPFADVFRPAHVTRFCFPGQPGSSNCATLIAPRRVLRVVIHTLAVAQTKTVSAAELVARDWTHAGTPGHEQSAHYIVDRDGTVTQMVREANVAFHVGRTVNPTSIGVEHADVCNDPAPYTDVLYERSAALVRDICRRHAIAVTPFTILGHVDAAPLGGHRDPGPYWDWQYYFNLLNWRPAVPGTHPERVVVAATDLAAPPTGWQRRARRAIGAQFCASITDSWSRVLFVARATDSATTPTEFRSIVSKAGIYTVTLWWPASPGGSKSVPVEVSAACTVSGSPCVALPATVVRIDQSRASNGWRDTGVAIDVRQPMDVRVRVHRSGAAAGNVMADAVRLIKIAPL